MGNDQPPNLLSIVSYKPPCYSSNEEMEQNVELQKMGGSGAVDPKCMGNINFEIICLTEDELWLIMPPIIIHKNPPNYLFWQRWPP